MKMSQLVWMSSLVDSTVAQLLYMSTSVISFLAVLGQNTIICPVILISKNKSIIIRIAAKTFLKVPINSYRLYSFPWDIEADFLQEIHNEKRRGEHICKLSNIYTIIWRLWNITNKKGNLWCCNLNHLFNVYWFGNVYVIAQMKSR